MAFGTFELARKQEKAARLLDVIKGSPAILTAIDESRREKSLRRAKILTDAAEAEKRMLPALDRTAKAQKVAHTKVEDLEAQLRAARDAEAKATQEAHAAWHSYHTIRAAAEYELRATADENIGTALNWLSTIENRARQDGLKMWLNTSRNFFGAKEQAIFSNLEDEVKPISAELKKIIAEVRSMQTSDYGEDPLPALRAAEERAQALIKPLAFDLDRLPKLELEDPYEV